MKNQGFIYTSLMSDIVHCA